MVLPGETRDGTVEPISRDQILRCERGQGNIQFPCLADHDQDWQRHPVYWSGPFPSGSSLLLWTVSEQDGSHMGEVALCLECLQSRHEHMSDGYIKPVNYCSIAVAHILSLYYDTRYHIWLTKELTKMGRQVGKH